MLTLVIASFLSLSSGSAESTNIVEPVAEEPATEEVVAEETLEEESMDEEIIQEENVAIEVEAGMDSRKIANLLEDAGVIESAKEFDQFLCANGYDVKMKVGHFDIPVGATEEEMAKILTKTN